LKRKSKPTWCSTAKKGGKGNSLSLILQFINSSSSEKRVDRTCPCLKEGKKHVADGLYRETQCEKKTSHDKSSLKRYTEEGR